MIEVFDDRDKLRSRLRELDKLNVRADIVFSREDLTFVLVGGVPDRDYYGCIQPYGRGDIGARLDTGYYVIHVESFREFWQNATAVSMIIDSLDSLYA